MAIRSISEFLQNLRRVALRSDEAGLTDGQLLDAYVRSREEAAFAALLRRHGPMVWGVCCRILGNGGDAEDAFQATFLVLVRKAASIVPREQIANWLYGVARQTAVKARAMTVKKKVREKQVKDMPEPAIAEQNRRDDLLPLLDQELGRLPDKYRMAIVLCDLEGKSYKEAARQLGCPEGTLAARLARGRAMLAKRLARHGRTVTSGALSMVLSQGTSADVPVSVVSSTIKAASLFAAGQAAATGAISAKVAGLTEGVLKTMLLTKLKIAMTVFLGVAVAGVGVGRCVYPLKGADSGSERQEGKEENASTPPPKKIVTDKEKLQGTWKVLVDEAEKQKQFFAVDEYKSSKFIVDRNRFVWELKSKKVKGGIYLDEKAKTFTMAYEGDGLDGEYQLRGDTFVFRGKTAYVKNKVLPQGPPNPIVLKREPPSVKNGKKEATAQRADGPAAENILRNAGFEEGDKSPAHWPRSEGRTRGSSKLKSLLKERVDVLRQNAESIKRLHEQGAAGSDAVGQANLRLYKAELDLCETTKDRIAVLEKIADVYKEIEDHLIPLKKQGAVSSDAMQDAKLNRLEAEIALEREKAKLAPSSK